MYKKNGIIFGAVLIVSLMISIPLIPALETSPVKTVTIAQNYQPPFRIISSTDSFLCPLLLAITLWFALDALRALGSLPGDIQYWLDSYNAGNISAYDLLIELVSCTTMYVINALYAKAGFRFFYNLWYDLCTGPSLVISDYSLTSISLIQGSAISSSVSNLKILTSGCGCDQ